MFGRNQQNSVIAIVCVLLAQLYPTLCNPMGCSPILQFCNSAIVCVLLAQLNPTLCKPMGCSPPGYSVYEIPSTKK